MLFYALIALFGAIISHYLTPAGAQLLKDITTSSDYHYISTWRTQTDTEPDYKVRIISHDPFIAHLQDFITPSERSHILDLAAPLLEPSHVIGNNGTRHPSPARTSHTAFLPEDDPVVTRLALRAADLQGWLPAEDIDIQVTAYGTGQQYHPHWDWFNTDPSHRDPTDRLSTIFAILAANCTGCRTRFPALRRGEGVGVSRDERWCGYLECGDEEGLTVMAVEGSAVYWRNLHGDGRGDERTLHAGLPVPEGVKVGLNIWTKTEVPVVLGGDGEVKMRM